MVEGQFCYLLPEEKSQKGLTLVNIVLAHLIRKSGFPALVRNFVLTYFKPTQTTNEPCHEKTNVLVSDQVRHKPGCAATEDG